MNKMIAFIDVDDTLVRTVGTKRIPIPRMVARVRELHAQGAMLYLWSSGGTDYAHESAIELGIEECFIGFLPKPNLLVDDQPFSEWKYLVHELPLSV